MKRTIGGADIQIEFQESSTSKGYWIARAEFDNQEFSTKALKSQTFAMHNLEQQIARYQKDQVAAQIEQKKLDAWNRGEPKRF